MTAQPPLSAQDLQGLDQRHSIHWDALSKPALNAERASQLAAVISRNTKLETLEITAAIDDEAAMVLAGAIRECPTLKAFHLKNQTLSQPALAALADAALSHPALQTFQMKETGIEPPLLQRICQQAGNLDSLHSICLSKNNAASNTRDLCDMVAKKHNWQRIRFMGCGLDENAITQIAQSLDEQPQLCRFHLQGNIEDSRSYDAIGNAILATGSNNLMSAFPSSDTAANQLHASVKANKQLMETAVRAVQDETALPAKINYQLCDRLPALRLLSSGSDRIGDIEDYLAELPTLPAGGTTADLLAASNHLGQSPAENPHTWQAPRDLLAQLSEQGATIDETWLAQKTPSGQTLLECGLACNAGAFVAALNQQGLQLGKEVLFDDTKQPTAAMQILIENRTCAAVFTADNWQEKQVSELRATFDALPQDVQSQIGGYHCLTASLRAAQNTERGR